MGTTTLTNLQGLLAGVAGVVGVLVMVGIAVAGLRYLTSPDSTDRKLPQLQKNVMRIVGVGVSCAILASASWYTSAFDYFADTGGMDDIEASAATAGTVTRPLSPDPASGWAIEAIPTFNAGTGADGSPIAGYDTAAASSTFKEKVASQCLEENRAVAVDWPRVFALLKAEGIPSSVDDLGWWAKTELKLYGIMDLSDPVLYDRALVMEGAAIQEAIEAETPTY